MFEVLTDKLSAVFSRLGSRGKLTEKDIDEALRQVRLAQGKNIDRIQRLLLWERADLRPGQRTELTELRDEQVLRNGVDVTESGDGVAVIRMAYDPRLVGDSETGVIHGGAVSALMDTCGGAAVWSQLGTEDRVSTVDLRVDYLRPGRPETLFGMGRVMRLGNRVGVAELRAYHEGGEDEPVAMGTGVYNIRRARAAESREMWSHVES